MPYPDKGAWWAPWRRRRSAWGAALLEQQQIVVAALTLQASGSLRVAWLGRPLPAPAGAPDVGGFNAFTDQLRDAGAPLPRRARTLALALHAECCRQGVLEPVAGLSPRQLAADVQLEAASALGVDPQNVGFDFEIADRAAAAPRVHWAACSRQELQHWTQQARHAGWRLRGVEPEAQAAQRAAASLGGEAVAWWAQSPQDWQFERQPARGLSETEWRGLRERLQVSPQWGPLVACGVALGQLA